MNIEKNAEDIENEWVERQEIKKTNHKDTLRINVVAVGRS